MVRQRLGLVGFPWPLPVRIHSSKSSRGLGHGQKFLLTCARHQSLGQLRAWTRPHDVRQRLDCIPVVRDGHQSIDRDLFSRYGMDDHKPYLMLWP